MASRVLLFCPLPATVLSLFVLPTSAAVSSSFLPVLEESSGQVATLSPSVEPPLHRTPILVQLRREADPLTRKPLVTQAAHEFNSPLGASLLLQF